jgi:hypothetical protein
MEASKRRRGGGSAQPGDSCPSCGGSGVLRTAAAGYRTCLDCVGQGRLPRFEAPPLLPIVDLQRRRQPSRGFRGDLSAWSSGAR